jgi:hypothetical protein
MEREVFTRLLTMDRADDPGHERSSVGSGKFEMQVAAFLLADLNANINGWVE